jgi:hypothetical protein
MLNVECFARKLAQRDDRWLPCVGEQPQGLGDRAGACGSQSKDEDVA